MEKEMRADVLSEQITREWKDAVNALQRIENTLTLEYLRFNREHEGTIYEMNYAEYAKNRVSYLKSELMTEYFDSILTHISVIKEEEMCAKEKEEENVLNNTQL